VSIDERLDKYAVMLTVMLVPVVGTHRQKGRHRSAATTGFLFGIEPGLFSSTDLTASPNTKLPSCDAHHGSLTQAALA